ncbi:hypothetical protein ES706_06169 [subsurface metagenome]
MRPGTYAAKPGCDSWYFLNGSAFAEFLEAPQFYDLKVGVLDFALVIEKDVYLCVSFQPSGRGYANNFFLYLVFLVLKLWIAHNSYLIYCMSYFVLFFILLLQLAARGILVM